MNHPGVARRWGGRGTSWERSLARRQLHAAAHPLPALPCMLVYMCIECGQNDEPAINPPATVKVPNNDYSATASCVAAPQACGTNQYAASNGQCAACGLRQVYIWATCTNNSVYMGHMYKQATGHMVLLHWLGYCKLPNRSQPASRWAGKAGWLAWRLASGCSLRTPAYAAIHCARTLTMLDCRWRRWQTPVGRSAGPAAQTTTLPSTHPRATTEPSCLCKLQRRGRRAPEAAE